MISINNLTVSYSENEVVIKDLDLQLSTNQIHGIVGLNGAGKTTLLNSIFGLITPSSGSIIFDDENLTPKYIAYLPTDNYFFSNVTGREYLALFKNREFDVESWNELFSLPLDAVIETYSTGMKKKLALLGILKMDRPILILDEPFNGLDIETSRVLRSILLRLLSKGKTIIITSHIIETLTNLCNMLHYLKDGRIKFSMGKDDFSTFENEIFEEIENRNRGKIDKLI